MLFIIKLYLHFTIWTTVLDSEKDNLSSFCLVSNNILQVYNDLIFLLEVSSATINKTLTPMSD